MPYCLDLESLSVHSPHCCLSILPDIYTYMCINIWLYHLTLLRSFSVPHEFQDKIHLTHNALHDGTSAPLLFFQVLSATLPSSSPSPPPFYWVIWSSLKTWCCFLSLCLCTSAHNFPSFWNSCLLLFRWFSSEPSSLEPWVTPVSFPLSYRTIISTLFVCLPLV